MRDAGYNVSTNPSFQKQFSYTYNAYGQKTSETNLNNVVTNYTYGDMWGNLTQVVQDPGGVGHLNRITTMDYDAGGHVLHATDPNGATSSFTYNSLGQPGTASFPATANTPAEVVTYGYGGNGRLESVSDNRGQTVLTYETGSDRVKSVADPVTGTIGYTYGVTGERLTMTLPGGGTWTYTYRNPATIGNWLTLPKDDPNSICPSLAAITDDASKVVEYTIDRVGQMRAARFAEGFDLGGNLTSYIQTDYTYDTAVGNALQTRGRLVSLANNYYVKSNGIWQQPRLLTANAYTYTTGGLRWTNQIAMDQVATRTETYGYDPQNRLTSVNYGDGGTQTYTFDAMGNRTQKTDGQSTDTYRYNNANMLTERNGQAYSNDLDGNTLTGGGRTSTWDSQNRLASCVYNGVTSTFTYSADGLRHRMVSNGVTTDYLLDNSMFVRERRGGANYATYLIGPRGPEYRRDDATGAVRWYCYDGLGSVLAEVDPNGNLTAKRSLDVYGAERSWSGTATSKHKFVGSLGHPSDDETGLIYMQHRYMDPVTGRFASQDPNGHGTNWFVYCADDPVNRADPDGRMDTLAGVLVSASLAAAGNMIYQVLMFGNINWANVALAFLAGAFGASIVGLAYIAVAPATSVYGASCPLIGWSAVSMGQWLLGQLISNGTSAAYMTGYSAMTGGSGRERQGGLIQVLEAGIGRSFQIELLLYSDDPDSYAIREGH